MIRLEKEGEERRHVKDVVEMKLGLSSGRVLVMI